MKLVKSCIALVIMTFFGKGQLYAHTIEVWPGAMKLDHYKIAKKTYERYLNSIRVGNKAYPLQTDLTHKYVKSNLMSTFIDLVYTRMNNHVLDEIQISEERYKFFQNALDPYEALVSLFGEFGNSYDEQLKKNFLKNSFKTIGDIIVEFAKESKGDYKKALSLGLLTKINTTITDTLFKDYPLAQLIVAKGIEMSLEVLYEYALKGNVKYLMDTISKYTLSGALRYLDLANNLLNFGNTLYALNSTKNSLKKLLLAELMHNFMFDYINKYDMDIQKMAKDSILEYRDSEVYLKHRVKPYFFNRVFIFYLMTHNEQGRVKNYNDSYLGRGIDKYDSGIVGIFANLIGEVFNANRVSLNYWDEDDLKLLTLAARDILDLIEQYGNGGNKIIVLDIEKNEVKINPRSYVVYSYYWMPDREFLLKNNYFWASRHFYECVNGIKDTIIVPFKKSVEISNRHINVNGTFEKEKFFYLMTLEKVINYKGLAMENYGVHENDTRLSHYIQKTYMKYNNIYALRFDEILKSLKDNNFKKIVKYFLKKGILNYYDAIDLKYISQQPLTVKEFEYLLVRYATSALFSKALKKDIRRAIVSLNKESYEPLRRIDAFKVFAHLLKETNTITTLFCSSKLPLDISYAQCMVVSNGISNGKNPSDKFNIVQAIIMLDRFDKLVQRSR